MKNLTLIVVRINGRGSLVESKPCYHCTCQLKKLGFVKSVIYSNSQGGIEFVRVKDLDNSHISRGRRT